MARQLAGEDILANDVNRAMAYVIRKSGPESVTSSAVLQNDNDFIAALPVGLFRIELMLHWSGDTVASGVGDIQTAWTTTGTITTMGRAAMGGGTNFVAATDMTIRMQGAALATALAFQGNGTSTNFLKEDLLLEVTVAGNLQFQWAQGSSSAVATTVATVSRMFITEIEDF